MRAASDPVRDTLDAGLRGLRLDLPAGARRRLMDYLGLLMRWNRSFNLTGTRAPEQLVTRHLMDCLSVAPHLRGGRVLDAGTGAGLPGMVLAVARPEVDFTLLDSAGKKTRFCIQAAAALGLGNVRVVRARIEALDADEPYSCLVSRAFLRAPELMTRALGLLAPGALVMVMKGVFPAAELGELEQAGYDARAEAVTVPGLPAARHLLRVEVPARSDA